MSLWKTHDLDYKLTGWHVNFKKLGSSGSLFFDQFPGTNELEYQKCMLLFLIFDGEFFSNDSYNNQFSL